MRRVVVISVIVAAFLGAAPVLDARTEGGTARRDVPLFTAGVEWGGTFNAYYFIHNNYISSDGARVNFEKYGLQYAFNGDILAKIGFNIGPNLNLSVYTGYSGLKGGHRVIPLTLRCTGYIGADPRENRWIVFGDAGVGFRASPHLRTLVSPMAKLGFGYRFPLSRRINLDILGHMQFYVTHPDIYEPSGEVVPPENTRRNNDDVGGIGVSVAISF